MDKFDDMIKHAKPSYSLHNTHFVEDTMTNINATHPFKRYGWKLWVPTLAGAVALVALVLIVTPAFFGAAHPQAATNNSTNTVPTASSTAPAMASGSDDASLESDLNSVEASQSQENNDQNSATNYLNDSSQQVAIPTD